MISNVDKLLLDSAQQAEIERAKQAWQSAMAIGDTAGMEAAHQRAESIRATAGYSGGESGDQYRLLNVAGTPAGYNAYEALVQNYIGSGMNSIAAGYQDQLAQLNSQRKQLEAQGEQNQAGARSAAWTQQRLAADGLLTHGLSNTGMANVITATALNQAAANAYRALLDSQNDLAENDLARTEARAEALSEAAELQAGVGELLGDAYSDFYENEAGRAQQLLLKQIDLDGDMAKSAKDYYYELALQQLKRQWELEDRALGL